MLGYLVVIAAVVFSAWRSQQALGQAESSSARLASRSVQGIELAAQLETLMHRAQLRLQLPALARRCVSG
jgi:hypothetical protein